MHNHFEFSVRLREDRLVTAAEKAADATSTGSALISSSGDSRIPGIPPSCVFRTG